jgi:hypothetical protein
MTKPRIVHKTSRLPVRQTTLSNVRPEPEHTPDGVCYPEAPLQHTVSDPDYVADLEQSDSQIRKRMIDRTRGKVVRPPREPR